MPEGVLIAIISSVVACVATLATAFATQRGNLRQAVVEHRSASYEALDARVAKLETQIGITRHRLEHALHYVHRLRAHIDNQLPPPPPEWPAELGEDGTPI